MSQMKSRDSNKPRRLERQEQAKARQAKYEAQTVQQRLAALDKAGLAATKERKKLATKVAEKPAQAAPVASGKAQKASPAPKASPKGKKAQKGA